MKIPALGLLLIMATGASIASFAAAAPLEKLVRPAPGVTKITISTPGDLSVRPGDDEKVVVEAEAKVLAQLDVSVKGDTLILASKGSFKTDRGLKYTVTIKTFRSLKAEGSGSSLIEGFAGESILVEAAGSGEITLKNIRPEKLTALIPGSGNINASGSGKLLYARIEGSGNIDTAKFQSKVAEARIDGSGTIRLHADETLKATIGGAGNIEYKGKAKVTQSITGAGNIERI
jgi:hypothetical protein